jgi:hypothetical protein
LTKDDFPKQWERKENHRKAKEKEKEKEKGKTEHQHRQKKKKLATSCKQRIIF